MSVDYRELLYTYMGCVLDIEGTTYVRSFEQYPDFNEEEYGVLMEMCYFLEKEREEYQ